MGGHRKNIDLRNCSRLSKHCTKPAFEDEMCTKGGLNNNNYTAMASVVAATADEHYDCIQPLNYLTHLLSACRLLIIARWMAKT